MEEEPRQGYYYVIPAELAECGKPYKALLYGLIVSLANKSGKCYASNEYLAKKLGYVDKSHVSRYIQELKKDGWIDYEIVPQEGNKRYLMIGHRLQHKTSMATAQEGLGLQPTQVIKESNIKEYKGTISKFKLKTEDYMESGNNPLYREWCFTRDPKPTFKVWVDQRAQ